MTPLVQVRILAILFCSFVVVDSRAQMPAGISTVPDRFDEGKMWTFEFAPAEYFSEEYQFSADEEWFEQARLGTLRIPGCTASFVSSYGLVLTNHHCSRYALTLVAQSGEDLLEEGFYASSLDEERPVPDLYADQLISIEDVTSVVTEALALAETDAEEASARREIFEAIQDSLTSNASLPEDEVVVEVVALYRGGVYSAYTFRRFSDVRLVLAPEIEVGTFGGDTDNFTFPRYTLDFTFFRVYQNGEPFEPEHSFLWGLEGVRSGEPVFVVGNPGSTRRLETLAQLHYRRDVANKHRLAFLESRARVFEETYSNTLDPDERKAMRLSSFSLRNAIKLYTGQLKALHDDRLLQRKGQSERQFLNDLQNKDGIQDSYGDVIDEMAAIQSQMMALSDPHGAFFALTHPSYSSAVMRRAILVHEWIEQHRAGAAEEALDSLEVQLDAIEDQSDMLGIGLLSARLTDLLNYLGPDSPVVDAVLQKRAPDDRARAVLDSSRLSTRASLQRLLAEESQDVVEQDPALRMIEPFIKSYRDYRRVSSGLSARQDRVSRRIGQARFEMYGAALSPDATFTLRIADGIVLGYPYNGTYASPFTSYFGMYDHYYSYGGDNEWALPERWATPPSSFDKSVPINFASTNDIVGGNSGSPVLNRDLELVGLVFDGNIESLAGAFIYLPEISRAISVDSRGILEALDEIYEANRLVLELIEDELEPAGEQAGQAGGPGSR